MFSDTAGMGCAMLCAGSLFHQCNHCGWKWGIYHHGCKIAEVIVKVKITKISYNTWGTKKLHKHKSAWNAMLLLIFTNHRNISKNKEVGQIPLLVLSRKQGCQKSIYQKNSCWRKLGHWKVAQNPELSKNRCQKDICGEKSCLKDSYQKKVC